MAPERARWEIWAAKRLVRGSIPGYAEELLEGLLEEAPYLGLCDPELLSEEVQRILVWICGWDHDTCWKVGQLIDAACRRAIESAMAHPMFGGRTA